MRQVKIFSATAVWLALAVSAQAEMILGVCEHVTRRWADFDNRVKVYEMCRDAGIRWVRPDFEWVTCEPKPGEWDWSVFDKVVRDAEKRGVTIFPILCYDNPAYGTKACDDLEHWQEYVRRILRRYRGKFPAVEVWNEQNLGMFWKNPNAEDYARLLKATYETVKAESPEVKVVMGATAGVDFGFIGNVYKAVGKGCFDAVGIHPYCWPNSPEGTLDKDIDSLRGMMEGFGDRAKPIWITEMGWPTHKATVGEPMAFKAGLELAKPGKRTWHAALVKATPQDGSVDPLAAAVAELLGNGSTARTFTGEELNAELPKGEIDLVVYPFGEDFPCDTVDAVRDFVAKGGVLVDFGGFPLYYPTVNGKNASAWTQGAPEGLEARKKLRISAKAWWWNPEVPQSCRAFVTERAAAAGYKTDPAGYEVGRFFGAELLKDGDEMIPMLVGKDVNGNEAVGACVYRFNSDMKGAVVVSSRGRLLGSVDEKTQGKYLAKAIQIAAKKGVEAFFIYEFKAPENDPYYSEDHFGIVHRDFTPKAAYSGLKKGLADPQIRKTLLEKE